MAATVEGVACVKGAVCISPQPARSWPVTCIIKQLSTHLINRSQDNSLQDFLIPIDRYDSIFWWTTHIIYHILFISRCAACLMTGLENIGPGYQTAECNLIFNRLLFDIIVTFYIKLHYHI